MTSLQVELRYGTPKHDRLKAAILARYEFSRQKMSERHNAWRKAEDMFQAYVFKKDEDISRQAKRDKGEPTFITVTIPYAYATLMTAHTYWTSVFLSRNPVLQFTARHGEPEMATQAVEAIMDYQVQVGKMLVPMFLWTLDAGKYGMGVVGDYWTHEKIQTSKLVEVPRTLMGVPIPGSARKEMQTVVADGYVGNRLYNVRPYDFFPDPTVPAIRLQDGEFVGCLSYVGWNKIAARAAEGYYFNTDQLKKASASLDRVASSSSMIEPSYGYDAPFGELLEKGKPVQVELLEMFWELVPRDWELSSSTTPEKWVFTLGQKDAIIGAQPLGTNANKYPYFLQSYDIDAYGMSGRGVLELLRPLNDTLDWLFNSHFYNTRKILNDQLIVDPSRVVLKDLTDGGPGRLIRLRPEAYGSDVRSVVSQLQVYDTTQAHIADAQRIVEIMQRVTGVNDNLMGLVNPGGRKTATEVRTSSNLGINRLKTVAEYNSALGWAPLAEAMLQNTQQLYDVQRMFKIAGNLMENAGRFVQITQEDIQGFFDFVPVDGTMPVDRFAQANLWKEILIGMARMPQIATQYDIGGIFAWMAQLAGLKNVQQFKVDVMPNDQVAQLAASGKVVPIGGAGAVGSNQAGTRIAT